MTSRTRRTIGLLAALAALSVLLVFVYSYNSNHQSGRGSVVRYAMPITVAAIPAYVAAEKGFWADQGLDVRPQMFSSGRLALDSLLANSADVMSVSETPLVQAIIQNHPILIVATVTKHHEAKFIARRDHGISRPEDIRGKKVATLPGTNSDYFMYRFLAAHAVSADAVNILPLQPPQMVQALMRGDIDGYFAWEPHIHYAKQQLPEDAVVFGPGDLYQGWHCVAMNRAFVEAHPAIVEKLLKGFVEAEVFVRTHPGEAQAIAAKYMNVDPAVIKTLWPEYQVQVALPRELVSLLRQEGEWVRTNSKVAGPLPDFRAFVYANALSQVRASSVTLETTP